jgi:hypothetical protein
MPVKFFNRLRDFRQSETTICLRNGKVFPVENYFKWSKKERKKNPDGFCNDDEIQLKFEF